MKIQTRIIIYAIILSIVYWVIDAAIDHLVFFKDLSFVQIFMTSLPAETLVTRLIGMAMIILLGLFISPMLSVNKKFHGITEKRGESKSKLSHDPNLLINLSYQIKTPLNAIVGFSDLLKDPKLSPESKKNYVNHIYNSGKYMLELVNNISDITKIETGQLYVSKSECQVNKLLDQIHSQFSGILKEKSKKEIGLILKTGIKDENFTLLTDQDKLKQILVNLLENAISLTDEGHIEFGYQKKDDLFLEFYVKDTGSGIRMERLEMIMDHFRNVVDKNMRPFDTVALRINISKQLIRLLGGKLTAESKLWEGSTFTFTIPLNEIEVYTKEDVEMEEKVDTYLWKEKQILIAEDVESNFIYLREVLRPTQVKVHWARNGKEAVEICKENDDIDLVLMDILMPEMDGYEAARLIKKGRPELPIIAQTAYSLEEEDYQESFKYFEQYITKPIWSHDLMNTLSVYLA
jgi:signal transduction histidine kinase/CheY-like chemotaxis protein